MQQYTALVLGLQGERGDQRVNWQLGRVQSANADGHVRFQEGRAKLYAPACRSARCNRRRAQARPQTPRQNGQRPQVRRIHPCCLHDF